MNDPLKPVIVALDFAELDAALELARQLDPHACRVKIGKELFTRAGPDSVRALNALGFDVFLDLKFHDIPNTVAAACVAAADLGCWMINIHASGGRAMMTAAADALRSHPQRPHLIAVTVLTSLDGQALSDVGLTCAPAEQVQRLAVLAEGCGLDGVVCSPLEIAQLRRAIRPDFALVTPGVRPAGSASDDQKRIATPATALTTGADYLVIGRPITRAPDPLQALTAINLECREVRGA